MTDFVNNFELNKAHRDSFFKNSESDIEKASKGEGSRGGKVIGHTKSGKPVYENANHPSHEKFTPQEHLEAAKLHESEAGKYTGGEEGYQRQNHLGEAKKHRGFVNTASDKPVLKQTDLGYNPVDEYYFIKIGGKKYTSEKGEGKAVFHQRMIEIYNKQNQPTHKHISDMSKDEMHTQAEKMGIKGHKDMSKQELQKKLVEVNVDKELEKHKEKKEEENLSEDDKYARELSDRDLSERYDFFHRKHKELGSKMPSGQFGKMRAVEKEWSRRNSLKKSVDTESLQKAYSVLGLK